MTEESSPVEQEAFIYHTQKIKKLLFLLIETAFLLLWGTSVFAQAFGKNKVQYKDFDFKILETPNFSIYHYLESPEYSTVAAGMLERWFKRYTSFFGFEPANRQPVIIYASHPHFQQTNIISGLIPQGIGGVTEGVRNRIVIPLTGVNRENDHVLGHELVHAFHFAMTGRRGISRESIRDFPLWFSEGLAEYLSLGRENSQTAMWLRDAVLNDDLPDINKLSSDPDYSPYRFGHALWAFIAGRWGDIACQEFFKAAVESGLRQAVREVLGLKWKDFSAEWKEKITLWAEDQIKNREAFTELGEPVISGGDGINISPAASPNGKLLAFFSGRGIFTLDLFIADAETGKIIRKISSAPASRHFDSLSFIDSSGAWAPDSSRLAFVVTRRGENAIAIADSRSGKIVQTLDCEDVDGINHLSWSPDGRYIAFSGTSQGMGDLYLYDLEKQSFTALTNDIYTDIQPSWSPDGKSIVFSSDRMGDTDIDKLRFSPPGLAIYNLASQKIEAFSFSKKAKHISPQFSPDGKSVYFISDLDGFIDVYRYSLTDKKLYRLTSVKTGVSGLTDLSPALSLSREDGKLFVNVFENRNYNIYSIDPETLTEREIHLHRGNAVKQSFYRWLTVALPPVPIIKDQVTRYLEAPETEFPERDDLTEKPYKPILSLASIGNIAAGVNISSLGLQFMGQALFTFDDMLNNHQIITALQVSDNIKDFGIQAAYINLKRHLNWGVAGEHFPTISAEIQSREIPEEAIELTQITRRTFTNRLIFLAEYPFSTNIRLEGLTGYTRIGFDYEKQTVVYSEEGILLESKEPLAAPDPLNLFQNQFALVGDYSFNGFTSPLKGFRFRLEAEPILGSLNFLAVTGDYRHYFFMRFASLAFRFLHSGRYLGDSENSLLAPYNIGAETYVRGYSLYSFEPSECRLIDGKLICPEFKRLLGTKIGVFNAELRIPILGNDQLGLLDFPYLPLTLVGFFDGGIAWSRDDPPLLEIATRSNERIPVFSAGGAVRINILGMLILQIYYAYPFQRPDKGGHWSFLFSAGW
ncbi:MAG: peptidase S9 [Spirochaetes bacterium]|nr:MAG: peptidase S9 [Spirochaetota bacterium]